MGATSSKEPWEEDIESGGSPAGDLTPEQEIERVLRFQNNYYKVLKQDPSTCTSASLKKAYYKLCLLYTSPSPRDATLSRMPSSA